MFEHFEIIIRMALQHCFNPPSLYWLSAMAVDNRSDFKNFLKGLPNLIKDVEKVQCSCFNTNNTTFSSIKFLEEGFEFSNEEIKASAIYINALDEDHIDCFKTAFDIGIPLIKKVCDLIVVAGKLPFLKFIHKNGCTLTEAMCFNAAYYLRFACYEYLVINGVRPSSVTRQIYEDSRF